MKAVTDELALLGRVTGVHHEPLRLDEPFVEVVRRFAHLPGTVALLSGGTLDCARHHILGVYPWLTLDGRRTRTAITAEEQRIELAEDPFTALRRLLRHCELPTAESSLPLTSGLLGYLAYDLKDCLERLPRTSIDDLGLPLMHLVAPSVLLVHDRVTDTTTLLGIEVDGDAAAAARHLARFRAALLAPAPEPGPAGAPSAAGLAAPAGGARHRESSFTREGYIAAVEAIRRYIVEGDLYQVNMSQRFQAPFTGDPYDCFADMFAANPAPFFAYVNAGDHQIVSTSPERFLELRDGRVETRPIKGTRPRGRTPVEDEARRTELVESAKEDAELSMIVDLLRNDLGKVCSPGSVRVQEHKRLETYRNVHHLVSTVIGELRPRADVVDLLRATFPGGSITGCPKIRAMEVIDELEPVRRHLYTGSIGYVGFDGTMDLSIAIRTATFTGGRVLFSVGGGIVYDSDPASEYEETLHKGQTLMQALHPATDDEPSAATVWQDGVFTAATEATIPFDSEGLSYGFGFFETLRVDAGRPILLDAHLRRFERSWQEFFTTAPPDVSWADVIAHLVARNGLARATAVVKLVAAAGNPSGGQLRPVVHVSARPYSPRPALVSAPGLRLATFPHPRQSPLAGHKTLNYLYYKLAGEWARRHGADEALILNVDGSVSETNTASLCCVVGETVYFPTSPHALPGTLAAEIRRHLHSWGIAVEDRRLTVADLVAADHVFVTNSLMGAVPVLSLDEADLGWDPTLSEKLTRAVFDGEGVFDER